MVNKLCNINVPVEQRKNMRGCDEGFWEEMAPKAET